MKSNSLFFLLGAVTMFLIMHYLGELKSTEEHAPVVRNIVTEEPDIAEQQPPENLSAEQDSIESEAPVAVQRTEPKRAELLEPDADFTKQLMEYMIADEVERARSRFAGIFADDPVKLKMLVDLAREKMSKDLQLSDQVFSDQLGSSEVDLFTKSESEYTDEDRRFLQQMEESQDKLTQQLEQNRIDYEDKLRNLLTSREFDEYRNRELEHARQELATQAETLARDIKISVKDLSDYQRGEIDRLALELGSRDLQSVPIGSSLAGMVGSVSDSTTDLYGEFDRRVAEVLTPAQNEARSKSSMVLFNVTE